GRTVVVAVKAHRARVPHRGRAFRAPGDQAILLDRRDDGVELHLDPRSPAHRPTPVAPVAVAVEQPDASHVRHQSWETLEILPELEDVLDRRANAKALLHLDRVAP